MAYQGLIKLPLHELLPSPVLCAEWRPAALSETPESYINDMARARASLREAERVIRAQEEHIRHLEGLALTDDLTGLLNRRGFAMALRREIAVARRDAGACGVLVMVDLDGFKSVNDRWGHGVGDDYLQEVAHALLGSVRAGDLVARLGGDEFAILFTRIDEVAGLKRLASLEESFNSRVALCGDGNLRLRASFGLARYGVGDDPERVMAAADYKLYRQKESRRVAGH